MEARLRWLSVHEIVVDVKSPNNCQRHLTAASNRRGECVAAEKRASRPFGGEGCVVWCCFRTWLQAEEIARVREVESCLQLYNRRTEVGPRTGEEKDGGGQSKAIRLRDGGLTSGPRILAGNGDSAMDQEDRSSKQEEPPLERGYGEGEGGGERRICRQKGADQILQSCDDGGLIGLNRG